MIVGIRLFFLESSMTAIVTQAATGSIYPTIMRSIPKSKEYQAYQTVLIAAEKNMQRAAVMA